MNKQEVINIVKKLSDEILSLGVHLRKVILYGSYAKNSATEYSDIDVLLVADEFTGIGFEDIALFTKVLRKFDNVHPKTINPYDYKNGDPFIVEINNSGIEINLN